ncbi:unnamed protein product, partial [Amoebophrya sp. A120]
KSCIRKNFYSSCSDGGVDVHATLNPVELEVLLEQGTTRTATTNSTSTVASTSCPKITSSPRMKNAGKNNKHHHLLHVVKDNLVCILRKLQTRILSPFRLYSSQLDQLLIALVEEEKEVILTRSETMIESYFLREVREGFPTTVVECATSSTSDSEELCDSSQEVSATTGHHQLGTTNSCTEMVTTKHCFTDLLRILCTAHVT